MKKAIITIVIILAFAAQVKATPIFSVSVNNIGSSSLHEITVSPGEAFSVDLNVTTNEDLIDIGARLEASASGIFDVTGGLYHSPWDILTNPIPVGDVDPLSDYLRGSPGFGNSVGPGFSLLATLDLGISSNAVLGSYIVNVTDVRSTISWITPGFLIGNSGPDFVVNVVPEPATLTLLGSGLIVMLSCRRRKNTIVKK